MADFVSDRKPNSHIGAPRVINNFLEISREVRLCVRLVLQVGHEDDEQR